MTAYYNENDKYAAQWLRNLIGAGHIAPGVVDDRSILDVAESDLDGFTQCHFFAGVGVWSYALRRAGWPDDRPVWTGSCPCQPFSGAGKREGIEDPRHLWPVWFRLIRECRPGVILGEQVASKDGLGWWDIVSNDLESEAYAAGAVDTCVPGVGGPHIRQRLYWLADAGGAGHTPRECAQLPGAQRHAEGRAAEQRGCASGGLANADGGYAGTERQQRSWEHRQQPEDGHARRLVDTDSVGPFRTQGFTPVQNCDGTDRRLQQRTGVDSRTSALNGFWRDADWLYCTDGKWRPVEPGSFPLAHGVANRVGKLRAYGNAINAEQAIQFIQAARGCIDAC